MPTAPRITILVEQLPQAQAGIPYSFQLTAEGGVPPYSWSIISGALPTGLSLSSSGLISGTPTVNGMSSFTVQVTNSNAADYEAPIEILDTGLAAVTSTLIGDEYVSQDRLFSRSEFLFDYSKYQLDAKFYFEGIFTNKSFVHPRTVSIWKLQRGRTTVTPSIVHTFQIPPQTFYKRIRFATPFTGHLVDELTPATSLPTGVTGGFVDYEDAFQVQMQEESSYTDAYDPHPTAILPNADSYIHKLRLIAYSPGATRASVEFPLSASGGQSDQDLGMSLYSTSSTSLVDIPKASLFKYMSAEWDTIESARFMATLSQQTAGSGIATLYDFTASSEVASVAVPVSASAMAVGVDLDLTDLVDGHIYGPKLKSSDGAGTAHFYKGRLRLNVYPLNNMNTYWRYACGEDLLSRESRIRFNPGVLDVVASTSMEGIGSASGSVTLVEGGTSDGVEIPVSFLAGWYGYIPVPGHDLDHIPAQNALADVHWATTLDNHETEKANGTLTVDLCLKAIEEVRQAAWQFELIASVVGSTESLSGITEMNFLRDALISDITDDLNEILAQAQARTHITTEYTGGQPPNGRDMLFANSNKHIIRTNLQDGVLTEGNRYWGYATEGVVESMIVYHIEAESPTDTDDLEPIAIGDILLQRTIKSPSDLDWEFDNTRYGIRELCFEVYFFNLMWEYSSSLDLSEDLVAPDAPVIEVVSVQGIDVNIRSNVLPNTLIDTVSSTVQISTTPNFTSNITEIKGGPLQSTFSLHAVGSDETPVDLYIRAKVTDYLGDSAWSNIVFVSANQFSATTGGGGGGSGEGITALTGDVTATGPGSAVATISNDTVTFAKMQNVSAYSVPARVSGTSGDLSEVAIGVEQLLGRGESGDVTVISIGSGLEINGTTLSSTGSVVQSVTASAFGARVYQSGAQNLNHNTPTILNFDSERWDFDDMHSTVSQTSRLTCQRSGLYEIFANVGISFNNNGLRQVLIKLNGHQPIAYANALSVQNNSANLFAVGTQWLLNEGDYIEVECYQNSGSTLTTYLAAGDSGSPEFSAQLIAPGVGNRISASAFGGEPATPVEGDLILYDNSPQIARYSGSIWAPWGPIYPLTAPVDGDFAWINQGGASVSTTNGGIYLLGPNGATTNLRIRKKAAPATPYTITIIFNAVLAHNTQHAGFCWRQSSDGKLVTFEVMSSNGASQIRVIKWTSPTAISASYFALNQDTQRPNILQITDNGTNRICRMSLNGDQFIDYHSVGRTDFMTADEVGFFVNTETTNVVNVAMHLLSWKETTP